VQPTFGRLPFVASLHFRVLPELLREGFLTLAVDTGDPGRDATPADACTRQQLMTRFAADDYVLGDLMVGLTVSDQFLFRNSEAGEP
jgi:hypothetical protein